MLARLHVEGTAFDASGMHPEQIITIDEKPDYFPNSTIVCQTSIIFPQQAYSDKKIRLAEQICDTRKKLPKDCFDSYPHNRTFYAFENNHRYTSISIVVGYDDTMLPNAVSVDTTEAKMTERFSFGTRKTALGNAPRSVKQIRDFGAKLFSGDVDASHTDHMLHWSQKMDEKTNTTLMCHANLAAMHYFKAVGANLVARRANLGGSYDFMPLQKSSAARPTDMYDIFSHTINIPKAEANDLFIALQRTRAEYLKLTNLSKMDGLVNAHILHEYRERGADAIKDKQITRIARRLNTRPTALKI